MDYAITNLINVCFVGFALVMAFDFANGIRKLWIKAGAPKPDQKGMHTLHTLGDQKEVKKFNTLDITPESIDLWMAPLEPLEEELPCCCHTAIATTPLLLAAGIGGTEQPDFATLQSTQLRRMCSEKGIRWRNQHGTKHLSKSEMLLALS